MSKPKVCKSVVCKRVTQRIDFSWWIWLATDLYVQSFIVSCMAVVLYCFAAAACQLDNLAAPYKQDSGSTFFTLQICNSMRLFISLSSVSSFLCTCVLLCLCGVLNIINQKTLSILMLSVNVSAAHTHTRMDRPEYDCFCTFLLLYCLRRALQSIPIHTNKWIRYYIYFICFSTAMKYEEVTVC